MIESAEMVWGEHTLDELHYKQQRAEERELLSRRAAAHESLEEALEELSRSWGWDDLSSQLQACEKALREAKAALTEGEQLTLSLSDSPTARLGTVLVNGRA